MELQAPQLVDSGSLHAPRSSECVWAVDPLSGSWWQRADLTGEGPGRGHLPHLLRQVQLWMGEWTGEASVQYKTPAERQQSCQ